MKVPRDLISCYDLVLKKSTDLWEVVALFFTANGRSISDSERGERRSTIRERYHDPGLKRSHSSANKLKGLF